ncbi:MAG: hypothetical protein HZB99_01670 [Candidatus Harrisonbacteria bacterium]|nr:hypothetical protein [Candidatus Harrisonbacteria bacterium]
MKFVKNFVRVEALALQRALELQKETDRGSLYLASSELQNEFGWAVDLASRGEDVCDLEGKVVGHRELSPAQLGLAGEIDEFTAVDFSGRGDAYLERLYLFAFNDPKIHKRSLFVFVKIVRQTRDSDWEIVVESAWKANDGVYSNQDNLIYRDFRKKELVH